MPAMLLDASSVLLQLDELWRGIGKSEGAGVLRACAMTIIVVCGEDDDPQAAAETLALLMKDYPSRAILIRLMRNIDEPVVRANVQCWMPFGGRQQICSEQIEIDAPAGRLSEVMPALRGVLVADLPVVVWCRSLEVAGTPEFRGLLALAGKLIVDTAAAPEAAGVLPLVHSLHASRAAISDLAWTRLTRWRETVYKVFQVPERSEKFRQTKEVRLLWSGVGMPTTVCYLASWLRTLAPQSRLRLGYADLQMPEKGMGRIREVVFSCAEATLRLRRPEGVGVAIEVDELKTKVLFPKLDAVSLLREELSVLDFDARFEATLAVADEVASLDVAMP